MTQKSLHPPHIFAVADMAYQEMMGVGGGVPQSQCCVIRWDNLMCLFLFCHYYCGAKPKQVEELWLDKLSFFVLIFWFWCNCSSSRFNEYNNMMFGWTPWSCLLTPLAMSIRILWKKLSLKQQLNGDSICIWLLQQWNILLW